MTPRQFLLGTAAVAVLAAPTYAAAQQGADNTTIGEVVVTARRVEESAQSIPVAVTAVSSQMLENYNVKRLDDLTKFSPGIGVSPATSSPATSVVSIRGLVVADALLTVDQSAGIYYDGVYLARGNGLRYILNNSEEIGQLEVLRGPQGTLFGRNTTGGAFNISSKAPSSELEGYAKVIVGDWKTLNMAFGANLPFGDQAGLRVSYQNIQDEGYAEAGNGQRLAYQRTEALHGRFVGDVNERLHVDLSASYLRGHNGQSAIKLVAAPSPANASLASAVAVIRAAQPSLSAAQAEALFKSYINGDRFNTDGTFGEPVRFDSTILAGTVSFDISDTMQIKSITGWTDFRSEAPADLDGTPFGILHTIGIQESRQISEELQLIGELGPVKYVAGAYYSQEEGEDYSFSDALVGANPFNPNIIDGFPTNTSQAVFAQINWEFIPRWTFTGGLRYSEDEREMRSLNRSGQPTSPGYVLPVTGPPIGVPGPANDAGQTMAGTQCKVPYYTPDSVFAFAANPSSPLVLQLDSPTQCAATFKRKDDAVDYLASLDFKLTDDILLYAKTSRGYRAGGQNVRGDATAVTGNAGTFNSFGPEQATQYEIGIKSMFWGNRARVNASIFQTDYDGIQRSVLVQTPVGTYTTVTNAASAKLKGAEIEGTVIPIPRLVLSATAGFFEGEYEEYMDGNLDRSPTPWGTPETTFSFTGRYSIPTSFGEIAANVDYAWYDTGRTLIPDPATATRGCRAVAPPACPALKIDPGLFVFYPSLGQFGARITASIEDWNTDISLFGTNLTDETVRDTSLQIFGYRVEYTGQPRFIGLEVRTRF